MMAPLFDSTHAVRFDLPTGYVRAGAHEQRLVLLPADALVELVRAASAHAGEALARALGSAFGARAATRLVSRESASVDEFVTQFAGEAALAGLGVVSVERWGRALVVVIEHFPLAVQLIAPLVGAALEAAAGRPVCCILLTQSEVAEKDGAARVLVASERAVQRVGEWLAAGASWGDALARLHGAQS